MRGHRGVVPPFDVHLAQPVGPHQLSGRIVGMRLQPGIDGCEVIDAVALGQRDERLDVVEHLGVAQCTPLGKGD